MAAGRSPVPISVSASFSFPVRDPRPRLHETDPHRRQPANGVVARKDPQVSTRARGGDGARSSELGARSSARAALCTCLCPCLLCGLCLAAAGAPPRPRVPTSRAGQGPSRGARLKRARGQWVAMGGACLRRVRCLYLWPAAWPARVAASRGARLVGAPRPSFCPSVRPTGRRWGPRRGLLTCAGDAARVRSRARQGLRGGRRS